jgi:hypothetical protein
VGAEEDSMKAWFLVEQDAVTRFPLAGESHFKKGAWKTDGHGTTYTFSKDGWGEILKGHNLLN